MRTIPLRKIINEAKWIKYIERTTEDTPKHLLVHSQILNSSFWKVQEDEKI